MKRVDPRLGQLCSHLRQALDLLENILVHPHALAPLEKPKPAPAEIRPPLDPDGRAYRVNEVSKMVGISRSGVWKAIQAKRLRRVKIGGRTVVLASDLQAWLDGLPAE